MKLCHLRPRATAATARIGLAAALCACGRGDSRTPQTQVAAGALSARTPAPAAACLRYATDTVRLTGIVTREPHYGAPNFGETPEQDRKLRVPMLQLERPVDVCGTGAVDDDGGESVPGVVKLQLNGPPRLFRTSLLPGRRVTVRGTLFPGTTGAHFTDVLLDVAAVDASL